MQSYFVLREHKYKYVSKTSAFVLRCAKIALILPLVNKNETYQFMEQEQKKRQNLSLCEEGTDSLLGVAIRAAVHAGKDIMAIYDDPHADFGIERKADNSPLTRADKAAHARIMTYLEPLGIPVLSEEGAHLPYEERCQWHRLWIVDPLDGTKEFIKRNGEFTVNIALVEGGTPVLGVIYVPTTQTLYWGQSQTHPLPKPHPLPPSPVGEGKARFASGREQSPLDLPKGFESLDSVLPVTMTGAWRVQLSNSRPHLTPLPTREGQGGGSSALGARPFTVVASRSHLSPETEAFINDLRREHPDLELVSSGSSLKICLVAEGKADIYPRHAPTMEWDTAAGHAIALAAGHEMVDATTGEPLTYNKPDLHNPWFIVR